MATPYMGLELPTVGGDTDRDGTQDLVNNFDLMDSHDHDQVGGNGKRVPVVRGIDWASGILSRTATYSLTNTDGVRVIFCNADGGGFTINLPQASQNIGRELVIKAKTASANLITISAGIGQNIDGAATKTVNNKGVVRLGSDGTNWWIL